MGKDKNPRRVAENEAMAAIADEFDEMLGEIERLVGEETWSATVRIELVRR